MQCKATTRQGRRCGGQAIEGAAVCRMHGGAAPQVRNAAQARIVLEKLLDPALAELAKLLNQKKVPAAVKRQAIDSILDRNGLKPVHQVEDVTPAERMSSAERLERLRVLYAQLVATTDPDSESDTVQ